MSEPQPIPQEDWRRTNPLSFVISAILSLRGAIVPMIAGLFGTGAIRQGWLVIVPALVGAGVLAILFSYLSWRRFRYRLGDTDIRVERGLLSRTARSVPYDRIQDVSLEQRLVPRLFGMVDVAIETGGGGKDEVRVRYVSGSEAEALREAVRARIGAATAMPGPPGEPEQASPALFAMDLKRLATFGLFEFSLVVFAVLAGAAQQFEFLLPFDLWNVRTWPPLPGGWTLEEIGTAAQFVAVVLGGAILALVGLATGLIRTVLRDYGFRLEDTPKGLRRRRGLLTRSDVVMPVHRVQALVLRTGLIRRLFGWHDLRVVSLGQDAKAGDHVVVPFAQLPEIAPVVAATGLALPSAQTAWQRTSLRYRIDRALLTLTPPAIAFLALLAVGPVLDLPVRATLPGLIVLFTVTALGAASAYFRWRHDCHALDDAHLFVRHGWLVPKLDIASPLKLQSVEIVRGPIARRRGYADLKFGLAGGRLELAGVPLEEARAIRAAILARIAAATPGRA